MVGRFVCSYRGVQIVLQNAEPQQWISESFGCVGGSQGGCRNIFQSCQLCSLIKTNKIQTNDSSNIVSLSLSLFCAFSAIAAGFSSFHIITMNENFQQKEKSNIHSPYDSFPSYTGNYYRQNLDWIELILHPPHFTTHFTQGMSYTIRNLDQDQQYEARVQAR